MVMDNMVMLPISTSSVIPDSTEPTKATEKLFLLSSQEMMVALPMMVTEWASGVIGQFFEICDVGRISRACSWVQYCL